MKFSILAFTLLFSTAASAAHDCVGPVKTIDIASDGRVNTSIEGIGTSNVVCFLDKQHGLYTAEACKAVFTMLTASKFSGGKVRLYFNIDKDTNCLKGSWIDYASSGLYYISAE